MKKSQWLIAWLVFPVLMYGESDDKVFSILKTTQAINVDGDLSDLAWSISDVATDFTQLEPTPGVSPSFQTEVYMLYDDEAIYIGARLFDDDPSKILKELVERDGRGNADRFFITFDTYRDGFNGVQFEVSAAGVQRDVKYSFSGTDSGWDAIWESSVAIVDDGWIIEMKIPYLSLRFPEKEVQEWNLQIGREIRRFREESYWNEIDPQENGFLNQSGTLEGLQDIKPPTRFSFTPYITTYLNTAYNPQASTDRFNAAPAYTAGMDMKLGLNDAFTLDMTLIPDFGQVISDNQVLNLSPFEIQFDENRAFFTEGTELFNKGGVFYSRRVGGRPFDYGKAGNDLSPGERVVENPDVTNLYNATKVSGRTASGLGVGVFNAVAKEMYATIENEEGVIRRVQTNPLTNYNMIVLDQNLSNNSFLTFLNTNVMRSGSAYDANVTGMLFSQRNKAQSYSVNGGINVSQKYFSDQTDLGHTWNIELEKISGNFQGEISFVEESDNYDPNDLGLVFAPNERTWRARASYVQFEPTKHFLSYRFFGDVNYKRLYDPNVFTDFSVGMGTFFLLNNRYAIGANLRIEPLETFDYFEPRTTDFSQSFRFPRNIGISSWVSSDYRRTFAFDGRVFYRSYEGNEREDLFIRMRPRVRISNQFSLILETELTKNALQAGYVNVRRLDELPQGFQDGDVMFGERDRTVIENSLAGKYIFTPTMSLNVRVRHYWDHVIYQQFSRLDTDGNLELLTFNGQVENGRGVYDRNFNIFNIDMNYIWRFAPGSDIIVNWKNQIAGNAFRENNSYFSNLSGLFDEVQQNNFSVKVIYWLDYNKLVG